MTRRTSWRGRGRGARSNLGLQGTAACAKAVGLRRDNAGEGGDRRARLLRTRVLSGSFFGTLVARTPSALSRALSTALSSTRPLSLSLSLPLPLLRRVFPSLSVSPHFSAMFNRYLTRIWSPEWITNMLPYHTVALSLLPRYRFLCLSIFTLSPDYPSFSSPRDQIVLNFVFYILHCAPCNVEHILRSKYTIERSLEKCIR